MSRTFALIPAAGKSTRMGRSKLTLPLDGRLVIERVIDALRQAGIEHILVVLAPHVPELMTLAQAAGAEVLMLAGETPDMRATVEAGLDWLDKHFAPRPDDAWLLVPADHPVLDAGVIRLMLQTRRKHPDASLIVPAYAGRRGHPALIDWKHVAGMRALPAGQGFNAYLRNHTEETYEVLVDSPTVLLDLDTPEDYERLQENWPKLSRGISSRVRTGMFWTDFIIGLWKATWLLSSVVVGVILGGMVRPPWLGDPVGVIVGLLIGFMFGVTGIMLVERVLGSFRRSGDD